MRDNQFELRSPGVAERGLLSRDRKRKLWGGPTVGAILRALEEKGYTGTPYHPSALLCSLLCNSVVVVVVCSVSCSLPGLAIVGSELSHVCV